jgi:hypothetical protein
MAFGLSGTSQNDFGNCSIFDWCRHKRDFMGSIPEPLWQTYNNRVEKNSGANGYGAPEMGK